MAPQEWVLDAGRVRLRDGSGLFVNVSAADIVAVEFKSRRSVQGCPVVLKPSDSLSGIEFSRFPLEPWLVLREPASGFGASCQIVLRSRDDRVTLRSFERDVDQVLVGNSWYPVAMSLLPEIDSLLRDNDAALGPITLRQYLKIARTPSPRIIFEHYESAKPQQPVKVVGARAAVFRGTLYPYQATGVRWIKALANEELGGILGDEMGLGKTVQVIAAIAEQSDARPNLVVAPATLLENWRREIAKFAPSFKVAVHRGSQRSGFPSVLRGFDIVITSYDTAVRDLALLKMIPWHFVIADEAQAVKNSETLRAHSISEIPKRAGLAVTGTPIENRLEDLWSIFDFSCPGVLGTLTEFRDRFENTIDGALALQRTVSPLLLRRRVGEVADDLPERIDIPVAIEMTGSEAEEYERVRREVLDEYGPTGTLVALTKLREFCTHPFVLRPADDDPTAHSSKYVRLIEILDEIFAARDKAILFTSFQRMIELAFSDISNRFEIPCFWIDGRTPVEDRQDTIDRFSETVGPALLLLNPRAAGTGLNIVAANHVIHYNLEWNPAIEDQASARAYRRGQQRPVTVHRLYYASTVEEVIDRRLALKRELASIAIVGTAGDADLADVAAALRLSPITED
jgi:SNF2 family DNA or RNA helicase